MRTTRTTRRAGALGIVALLALAFAGCRTNESQMTSFSNGSNAATPQLFTIPQDQMSHVQVVTVQPAKLTRTLRLTGAVAYNAFKTTPVITQVGGPVSRILVVPGQQVKEGDPMLEVSSPDYSQLLDAYLKAADSFRLADKNYARAKDLYDHHAIAERDLQQAESDRTQAEADRNAAEQGMKILGIKSPEDLAKAPSSAQISVLAPISGEVVERLVSPGQVVQGGQTQAFTISDMSTVWVLANVYQGDLAYVRSERRCGGSDGCLPRYFSRKNLVRVPRARSKHTHPASARRRGQSRRKIEARHVLHGHGHGGLDPKRFGRARCRRSAR